MPIICTKNSFFRAAEAGNIKDLEAHFNSRFYKDTWLDYSPYGSSPPLIWAAISNHLEVSRLLIKKGANFNKQNQYGNTALILAANKGHTEIVRLLVEAGADTTIKNNGGRTALTCAENNPEMLRILDPEYDAKQQAKAKAEAEAKMKAKEAVESWAKMGDDRIAFIGIYPTLQKKITEIFNLESRERFIITEDLQKNQTTSTPASSFDTLPENLRQKIFDKFTALGGSSDRDFVLHGTRQLDKPSSGVRTCP